MKTRYVIDDKVYNVESSELIFEGVVRADKVFVPPIDRYSFFNFDGRLYRTKKGNFFMVNEERAIAVEEQAVKYHFKNHDYDMYVKLFGELEEA
ncbi:MAG: hypothetical protein Q4A72_05395 [Bacillota bacterium]|nr:hypothetical protein [Bacillota bacterium]